MEEKKSTYWECLKEGEAALSSAGIEEASTDAWLLFEETFGMSRARYYMDRGLVCDDEKRKQYEQRIELRAKRIPLQHITGRAPFMGYEFFVNANVLIPRADTEVLAEQAFLEMKRQFRIKESSGAGLAPVQVLDMCTGSGCIAISLACMAREAGLACEITAVDLSCGALAVAERNNRQLCGGCVQFIRSNLFDALPDTKKFDIIVSNPPYIRSGEIEKLMPEVRVHEPWMALDGKEDGLYFYRKIVEDGRYFLKEKGAILFEIGYDQGMQVLRILECNGYEQGRITKDLAGLDRVAAAWKEEKQ